MENNISKKIYKILDEAKKISTIYPDKSYEMSEEAYYMSINNNLKTEEGYTLIAMSFACRVKSENNKVLDYSYNALEIFEEEDDILGQIKALNLIGIAYFYSSMYEEALKNLLQVIDLLDEVQDYFLLSCVLNNIGEVYRESAKYEKAIEYYDSALQICINNDLKINTASIFNNIGEIYFIENKYDEAMKYFTNSYEILIEEKDMITLGEVENKLGKLYYITKDYNKAEEYFFSALKRLENVNNKFYAIDVLNNIAMLKSDKDSSEAFYYFDKAIQFAEEINAKKKLSEICKTLSEYYEKAGNFKVALEYFKKYSGVNEEIMTSNIGNKLEILKIELGYLKDKDKFEKVKIINHRLEREISNKRKELENIKKSNKVLEKKTFEDELTKIPNRRFINHYLNNSWEKFLLRDEMIVLFIIDIDNFKKYNDYWGHSKGDECLINVANCLKNIQERRNDIVARYGGEEFIYFAKGINYVQALELGNLIRKEVEKLGLEYVLDNQSKIVTISVGGAIGKTSIFNNIPDIIQIADKELYKVKDMGRNNTYLKNIL